MSSKECYQEPWNDCPELWTTKAKFFSWVRGQLRSASTHYPVKTIFKKSSMRPLTSEERSSGRFHANTKSVGECVLCKESFKGADLEVDHKVASDGCYDHETAEGFLWHCLGAVKGMYQLVCKPCHKIKSYADKYGITFEEAKIEKGVIEICKGKGSPEKVWLIKKGVVPEGNKSKRKGQVREVLKQG